MHPIKLMLLYTGNLTSRKYLLVNLTGKFFRMFTKNLKLSEYHKLDNLHGIISYYEDQVLNYEIQV